MLLFKTLGLYYLSLLACCQNVGAAETKNASNLQRKRTVIAKHPGLRLDRYVCLKNSHTKQTSFEAWICKKDFLVVQQAISFLEVLQLVPQTLYGSSAQSWFGLCFTTSLDILRTHLQKCKTTGKRKYNDSCSSGRCLVRYHDKALYRQ